MTLKRRLVATSTAGIILATSSLAFSQKSTTPAVKTGYDPVNGLSLYYEIHGTGEPLILLHGGVVGITISAQTWRHYPRNARSSPSNCRVTGHTADIDRPLSFEAMADDIEALIKLSLAKIPSAWN